jgi:hypothetical protein
LARGVLLLWCLAGCLAAQELQPRAYIPAPVGLNFFGVSYANNAGGLLFDPSLPVEDGYVNANIVNLSFGQTLGVMGRTAQVLAIVPYAVANLSGRLGGGSEQHLYRSGLGDMVFRYAMNIHGAPSMKLKEYAGYRQKSIFSIIRGKGKKRQSAFAEQFHEFTWGEKDFAGHYSGIRVR